jgi:hypothetical protein
MANTRLYRENITFLLAHPEAFANRTAPTVAELNGLLVYNVTCALNEDGTEFTLGDSDTDDSLTFCSKAGISTPTFYNPTVMMEFYRDSSVSATGIFNKAFDLMAWPDVEYISILRIGKDSDAAFAVADKIKMVGVKTDWGTDVAASGENMRMTQAFLNNDFVNWNYEVAA